MEMTIVLCSECGMNYMLIPSSEFKNKTEFKEGLCQTCHFYQIDEKQQKAAIWPGETPPIDKHIFEGET